MQQKQKGFKFVERIYMLVAFALFLFLSTKAFAGLQIIENKDYNFRLKLPNKDWVLFEENQVKQFSPDAAAGAFKNTGIFGVVIVEKLPNIEIDTYMDMIIGAMPLENKRIEKREPIQFLDRSAIRSLVRGKAAEIDFCYQILVFRRGDWVYQLIGYGISENVDAEGSVLAPFFQAFSLTEGELKARAEAPDDRFAMGVGWRLSTGKFESAAYGFSIHPPKGWRAVVGDELEGMNSDAEVGLLESVLGLYLVVIPERLAGINKATFTKSYFEDLLADHEQDSYAEDLSMPFANATMPAFRLGPTNENPFEYIFILYWHGDTAIKVTAWYTPETHDTAVPAIKSALTSFHFMDNAEQKAVDLALKAIPDTQNSVGPDFSLRRGIYRNFSMNFLWHKPEGYWRIKLGQEARLINEEATLFIEEPSSGLFGLVLGEKIKDFSLSSYHDLVWKSHWETEAERKKVKNGKYILDGLPAMFAQGPMKIEGREAVYRITTVKVGEWGLQINFWGLEGNIKDKNIDYALSGFRWPKIPYKIGRLEDDVWVDNRLGFKLRRPEFNWIFKDQTPENMRALASIVQWSHGKEFLGVTALCGIQQEQDEKVYIQTVASAVIESITKKSKLQPEVSEITFKGKSAMLYRWSKAQVLVMVRDRTAYIVIGVSKSRKSMIRLKQIDRLLVFLK